MQVSTIGLMISFDDMRKLAQVTPSKIVVLVMDGVGGLPDHETGRTELETAHRPNLNGVADAGICGVTYTVSPGITPGSAPGHLALFGYDPREYNIGRGIVEALGLDIEVNAGDVVARGNFCTIDEHGRISDRRAGRLPSETTVELCTLLNDKIHANGADIAFFPGKEHRFVVRLRAEGLSAQVTDTDPQHEGLEPLKAQAIDDSAEATSDLINDVVMQVRALLSARQPANMVLLRGFSQHPDFPSLSDVFHLTPACIAVYPMYRGVARVVGMDILPTGDTLHDQIEVLTQNWDSYDYFFVHYKRTDARGEDGDFDAKVKAGEHHAVEACDLLLNDGGERIVLLDDAGALDGLGHGLLGRLEKPQLLDGVELAEEALAAGALVPLGADRIVEARVLVELAGEQTLGKRATDDRGHIVLLAPRQ